MTLLKLLFRNLRYFLKEHLLLSAGLLTSTAILSSALIIGDSVDYSLKRIASERLGETRHVLLAQERFFPSTLARKIEKELKIPTAAVLLLEGTALNDGRTATELQLCGVDTDFWTFGKSKLSQPGNNEVIINEVLAESLNLQTGDEFLIRIPNPGFVTKNSTFVPDDENRIAVRMKVKAIAGPGDFGNFSLKSNQLTPQTVFFSLDVLSDLLFEGSFANLILIAENRYSTQELYQALQRSWSLEDINLSLRKLEKQAKTELISDRVFIEDTLLNMLRETAFNPEPVLTYLVNRLVLENKLTPYSFVSGLSDLPTEAPGAGEILLNTWLAEDLQAQIGDSIELEYFVPESFRKLNTSRASFRVKDIIPLEGFARDSLLMPAFEGFSGVESCSDWETGIPVDYSSIRPKDELWWSEHRGTPKAFIAYETARNLWGQEYGNSTALRFGLEHAPQAIEQSILNQLHPASMGLNIRDVKQESNWSASNAVDFAQLFLGLSFFLILAALLLSALLFGMLLQQRNKEQGLYRSLGLSRNKIYGIFLSEALLNAFVSSLLGVFAGIGFSKLLLYFINSIWIDIVRTSSIGLFVHRSSLLTGFAANLLVAAAVLLILLKKHFGAAIAHLQKNKPDPGLQHNNGRAWLITAVCSGSLFLLLWLFSLLKDLYQNSLLHFVSGFLLLLSLNALFAYFLIKNRTKSSNSFSVGQLIANNLKYNYKQNISIAAILSIGLFIVLSTGAYRNDVGRDAANNSSGTGGYLFYVQNSLPLNLDLSSAEGRQKLGLQEDYPDLSLVQMLKLEDDDASCLNLNRISRPSILGVNPRIFIDREAFSFVKSRAKKGLNSWSLLSEPLGENLVPAVADQTVITWGLGKAVGDTLFYLNEKGDSIGLVLVAGLSSSVFQGNLLISEANFRQHFPSNSGSRIMLADVDKSKENELRDDLNNALRSYGVQVQDSARRLADFNSVTNTYLDIFLALGGIALILGTLGIAIVLIKSITARKYQFALMQAFGMRMSSIRRMLIYEYMFLILTGLLTGLLSSFATSAVSLLANPAQIPLDTIALILLLFLLNSFVWIYLATSLSLKKDLIRDLRNE